MGTLDNIMSGAKTLLDAGKIEEYKEILALLEKERKQEDEIRELKNENRQLKEDLEIKGKLELKNNFYYINTDGPFCTKCRDDEKKLVRAHATSLSSDYSTCPKCKTCLNYTGRENDTDVISVDYGDFLS